MLTRPFDDSSSDYGPDFTAEEEELVNELLAKIASEHAAVPPPTTPDRHQPGPPPPPQNQSPHQPVATVTDIEDYNEGRSRARSPKVRGREKLASPWSRKTTFQHSSPRAPRGSNQVSGNPGTAHGMVFSFLVFLFVH